MAMDMTNPCCASWKSRYSKMEEKRNALRQGVEILKGQIDRLQLENLNLKKSYDEERRRANVVEEEKAKEASLRVSMEKEIATLKSEISATKPEVVSGNEDFDKEVTLLRACISERDMEIEGLKRLITEKEQKALAEKEAAELEKIRAIQLQEALSSEKSRADEAIKVADAAGKKAEDIRVQLNSLKKEVEKARLKYEEANRKLESEKQKAIKEKKRADEEKARAAELKKVAEANEKKIMEERSQAKYLLKQLEEQKQKVDKLETELQKLVSCQRSADLSELDEVKKDLDAEKKMAAMEKKRADAEMLKKEEQRKLAESHIEKALEEKGRADKLSIELQIRRQKIEGLENQLHELNDMLKAEREKVCREQKRADAEKLKTEEQARISSEFEKRAMEEKRRADNLSQELENDRKRLQGLENESHELKFCDNPSKVSSIAPATVVNDQTAIVSLLQKQLKFEKQRVKHEKEVSKLEKGRNSILQQELERLRQDFECFLHHLDMLGDTFGARHGLNIISKKGGLPDVPGQLSRRMMDGRLSDMPLCGEAEGRLSSLSSRDASCHLKETQGFVTGRCMESPSASFSDEQLMGSQERVAGSLTSSVVLAAENTNLPTTVAMRCTEPYNFNGNEKVGIVAENSIRSPVDGRAQKRRRILDEFESIRSMQSEGKKIFQEAEEKLSALRSTLVQPIIEQIEKENLPLPTNKANTFGNYHESIKRRKAPQKQDPVVHVFNAQAKMNNIEAIAPIAPERVESARALKDATGVQVKCNQDAMLSFDQVMNGDYMDLLNMDDSVEEEYFRAAMKTPLSPTLPEIDLRDCEMTIGTEIPSMPVSKCNDSGDQHSSSVPETTQLCCVVFSDMEDMSSLSKLLYATRTCLTRCRWFLERNWLVHDILVALALEKDLRPREKVCVLFSLILLNFSVVSSGKCEYFRNQEWLDSFSSHLFSVLSDIETRKLFAEICDFNEFISIIEEFLLSRRIFSLNDASLYGLGRTRLEILDEKENNLLSASTASNNLVIAGGVILASFCTAFGHIGPVYEVSFNMLRLCRAEYPLVLKILHIFPQICGKKFLTLSNYHLVTVVKSVVQFIEGTLANNDDVRVQAGTDSLPQFSPCVTCPFSEGSSSVDDISSILLQELQKYCSGHATSQDLLELPHSSELKSLDCIFADVLSLLELIAFTMGWDWSRTKIIPELFKIMKSCDAERNYTALVAFLGELGRFGVEACGYDDAGVESIRCHLSDSLCCTVATKCNPPRPIAILSSLLPLYPKGLEEFVKGNKEILSKTGLPAFAASDTLSKCLSSLSSEQLSSLFDLQKSVISSIVAQ